VLAKVIGPTRVVAAEVEKAKRRTVDLVAIAVDFQLAGRQIPVGDVEPRVAEDVYARPNPRRQVDPALVDEATLLGVVEAVVLESLRPPVEQRVTCLAAVEADESQVVGAGDKDVLFARLAVVAGKGCGDVGDEDHTVRAGAAVDLLDRVEEPNVRVEVGDRLDLWSLQQVS
jgi:hypothetical protein